MVVNMPFPKNIDKQCADDGKLIKEDSAVSTKEKQMTYVIFEDGIYLFNAVEISDLDCYDYQIFGIVACKRCEYKKDECTGGKSKETGVNEFGNKIPLAIKIADRERKYGKDGKIIDTDDGVKDGEN